MKKFVLKIIIAILFLSSFHVNNVNATELKSFEVVGVSDSSYVLDLLVGKSNNDISNIAYIDENLNDFLFFSAPSHKEKVTYGVLYWEEPDYIIKTGEQNVNLLYHDIRQNVDIVFNVYILGIDGSLQDNNKQTTNDNILFNLKIPNIIYEGFIGGDILNIFPKINPTNKYGKEIAGELSFPDWDNTKEGEYSFTWIFTPYDAAYNSVSDTIKVKLSPRPNEEIETPTTPSLTATTIQLDNKTAYDINLNDKVLGSTYLWFADDTDVIEVNPKNGKIKAKKEGNATVTCEITLPDGNKNVLESLVIVGYDENAPLLTETILDLEVGDKFDINLENKIAKSKYRWTSSNRNIVKVNSSNGKVTANGIGEAYVTCTITTPENQVIVLKCDINVTELEIITE